jgi:hypothetical protein
MCALAPVPRIPPVATTPTTSRLVGPEPARPCVFGRPWPGKGQGRNTSICTAGATSKSRGRVIAGGFIQIPALTY